MASLKFDSGPRTDERIPLDKDRVSVGRSRFCDCVLSHPTVSREHFYVERNNGKMFLVDMGGENGTLVNAERTTWIELKDGDKIQAGPFSMIFEADKPVSANRESSGTDESPDVRVESSEPLVASGGHRAYPSQYLMGIEQFNAGGYFDAHEVWEEIWLHSSGETKLFYQMLIQAAVALHHYERGNARGARGMHANVIEKLSRLPSFFMSLDLVDFSRQFKSAFSELIDNNNEAAPAADEHRPRITLLSRDITD